MPTSERVRRIQIKQGYGIGKGVYLCEADLRGAVLTGAWLSEANLPSARRTYKILPNLAELNGLHSIFTYVLYRGQVVFTMEDATMYGTRAVLDRLISEGFTCSDAYLRFLMRDRHLAMPPAGPGGCLLWEDADLERLRQVLRRRGRGPGGVRA